jgi:hypothetical protein
MDLNLRVSKNQWDTDWNSAASENRFYRIYKSDKKAKKKNILKPRKATSRPLTVVITSFHAKYRPCTFLPYHFTSLSPSQYDVSKLVYSTRIMYAHQVIWHGSKVGGPTFWPMNGVFWRWAARCWTADGLSVHMSTRCFARFGGRGADLLAVILTRSSEFDLGVPDLALSSTIWATLCLQRELSETRRARAHSWNEKNHHLWQQSDTEWSLNVWRWPRHTDVWDQAASRFGGLHCKATVRTICLHYFVMGWEMMRRASCTRSLWLMMRERKIWTFACMYRDRFGFLLAVTCWRRHTPKPENLPCICEW